MTCERCGKAGETRWDDGEQIGTTQYAGTQFRAALCNGCHNALTIAVMQGEHETEAAEIQATWRYYQDSAGNPWARDIEAYLDLARRQSRHELALFRFMAAFVADGKGGGA